MADFCQQQTFCTLTSKLLVGLEPNFVWVILLLMATLWYVYKACCERSEVRIPVMADFCHQQTLLHYNSWTTCLIGTKFCVRGFIANGYTSILVQGISWETRSSNPRHVRFLSPTNVLYYKSWTTGPTGTNFRKPLSVYACHSVSICVYASVYCLLLWEVRGLNPRLGRCLSPTDVLHSWTTGRTKFCVRFEATFKYWFKACQWVSLSVYASVSKLSLSNLNNIFECFDKTGCDYFV